MKLGCVTPVFKPSKPKNLITSYRPITVTPNISRIFEKLIFNNL